MTAISNADLHRELFHSKQSLEGTLGAEITDFSHPFAFPEHNPGYVQMYRRELEACGYRAGATTVIGTVDDSSDPLIMPRLPANEFDDRLLLAAKLSSSYNWLQKVQISMKRVTRSA
jgi:hypothetical protein